MRSMALIFAAAAVTTGAVVGGQGLLAAHLHNQTTVQQPAVVNAPQSTHQWQPLDCFGTTGGMGCGPGWVWRDGWRGWACYPC